MAEKFTDIVNRQFQKLEERMNGEKNSEVHGRRRTAMERFRETGLPTLKHEEWKYTNLSFLYSKDFAFEPDKMPRLTKDYIDRFAIPQMDADIVAIINGKFSEELSQIKKSKGVVITSLADALRHGDEIATAHFGRYAEIQSNPLTAMNTAIATDGAFIRADKAAAADRPIHIIYINTTDSAPVFSLARNLVIAGEAASLKIIESHHSTGREFSAFNAVTEIRINQAASVDHYKVQADSANSHFIGRTQAHQERDSNFADYTFTLDGDFVRNDTNAVLDGEGCSSNFIGLYYADKKNLVDNHTLVDHARPNSLSNENYRGILGDRGTGIFNGKIMVRQDAQKTEAYQSNRNILLSDTAAINTKPQLEIFADDVKCSHGATSGSIDPEQIFYLKSRGLSGDQARRLLLEAFALDIVNRVKLPELNEYLKQLISKRLNY
ncbi:MAG: Fe-S cluster assembly protein SufD [Candidatus Kapaibacterium sp.]